ncbi:hypothetical protein AX16_005330 [Volvariella volvacea WC 439]|nr:hypothetical protein AX16_005330 [Volvariella volvacea WC 439]
MQTTNASLSDLPNELLDHILSFVPAGMRADTLLKFALLCRRLNMMFISYYLQLSGLEPPVTDVTLILYISQTNGANSHMKILRALRIAFSLRHMKALKCCIMQSETVLSRPGLVHILDGLHDLIARLDHIDNVQLHIWNRYPRGAANHRSEMDDLLERQEWEKSYGRSVNVLKNKSSNVTAGHEVMPFHRSHRENPSLASNSFSRNLRNFFSLPSQSPSHTPSKTYWPGQAQERIDERGHSTNEHLTLYAISLAPDAWDLVIDLISPTIPQLHHLKIYGSNILPSPLVRLLSHLPHPRSLETDLRADERHSIAVLPSSIHETAMAKASRS